MSSTTIMCLRQIFSIPVPVHLFEGKTLCTSLHCSNDRSFPINNVRSSLAQNLYGVNVTLLFRVNANEECRRCQNLRHFCFLARE